MNDDRGLDHQGGRTYGPAPGSPPPHIHVRYRRRQRKQSPQRTVDQYWNKLSSRYPGKILNILPDNPYVLQRAANTPHGPIHGQREARSYEKARAECIRDVDRIIRECRRVNQKYRDPHFDIEFDLKTGQRNCLDGLSKCSEGMKPKGVKRVTDIFVDPQFYINGPTAGDVRQGRDGDCYLMAALCGLGNMEGLINKICVKRDQDVGVYGFVFFRDGEWQQTIIDDKLYLRAPDYDEAQDERVVWDDINRVDSAEEYRKTHQTGSRALYFAQCSEDNETWLPLLEKAYAKAHGDFSSIDGGFTGEAIEDLTGGVTSEVYSTDILDKEKFWKDELMQVGKSFLFGCATGFLAGWLDTTGNNAPRERQGIAEGHAYSIMEAREVKGERLLKLRNPWGKKEWDGRWSDGSAEWTPEWMQILDHKFGNDGIFWISYQDLLRKYQHFDRTRIFGPEWNVTQCWTSVDVSWSAEYHSTKFSLTLREKGPVVIVLSQLDETYFGGLEGGYVFDLQFRLEDDSRKERNDYILRSNGQYAMARSVSADTELEAGTYSVRIKITATRDFNISLIEDVLPTYAATRREKLIQMGRSYDLAHAKGATTESREEKDRRKAREKAKKIKERENLKAKLREEARKHWERQKIRFERNNQRKLRRAEAMTQRDQENRQTNMNGTMNRPRRQDTTDSMIVQDSASFRSVQSHPLLQEESAIRRSGGEIDEPPEEHASLSRNQSYSGDTIPVDGSSPAVHKPEDVPESGQQQEEDHDMDKHEDSNRTLVTGLVQPLETVIKEAEQRADEEADQEGLPKKQLPSITIDGSIAHEEGQQGLSAVKINGVDAITDLKPLSNSPHITKSEEFIIPHRALDPDDKASTNVDPLLDTNAVPIQLAKESDANTIHTVASAHNQELPASDLNRRPPRAHVVIEAAQPVDGPGDISDPDFFPPFDWDSELDMPTETSSSSAASLSGAPDDSSDSEHEFYHGFEAQRRQRQRRASERRGYTMNRRGGPRSPSPPPQPGGEDPAGGRRGDENDSDGPADAWNAVCVLGLRVYSTLSAEQLALKVLNTKRGNHHHHRTSKTRPPPVPPQVTSTPPNKSSTKYAAVDNERVIMPGDDVLYHDRDYNDMVISPRDAAKRDNEIDFDEDKDLDLDEVALDPDDMNKGGIIAADLNTPSTPSLENGRSGRDGKLQRKLQGRPQSLLQ